MLWYTAKCAFLSMHIGEEPLHESLGEYRFFLLQASDEDVARKKALVLAKQQEHSYDNQYAATVRWVFDKLVDVKEIIGKEIHEGTEIYSEYYSIS